MKKKKKGGASTFVLSLYVVVLISLFICHSAHSRNLNLLRNNFDTGLLLSLLGASTINLEEYGATGNRVIHSICEEDDILNAPENMITDDEYVKGAFSTFERLLETNLGLDEQKVSANPHVIGPVEIEYFTIYNVYEDAYTGGTRTYSMTYSDGEWSSYAFPLNTHIHLTDHAGRDREVTATTLLAEIGFEIAVFPYFPGLQDLVPEEAKNLKVHMRRIVAMPEN